MTDAKIPVKIGLKGYFGSMLAAMASSAPPARLERRCARAFKKTTSIDDPHLDFSFSLVPISSLGAPRSNTLSPTQAPSLNTRP
jgi:hypothetical protein